jgi:hypothetical protein
MPKRTCSITNCERTAVCRTWCVLHYHRWQNTGDPEMVRKSGTKPTDHSVRFWAKVNKDGPIPEFAPHLGKCWDWTASVDVNGYGRFGRYRRKGETGLAHRMAFEYIRGDAAVGLSLDHLCRRPNCVNPNHLDPVPHRENMRRGLKGVLKTHCNRGHEYTPENTYHAPKTGHRQCLTCNRARRLQRTLKTARDRKKII